MHRRTLLGLCGTGLAGLAGCQSAPPGGQNDDTTETVAGTPPEGGTGTETATSIETAVTVEDIVVRKAVSYSSTMGSGGVLTAQGTQYVIATVRSNRSLDNPSFRFETDRNTWEPGVGDTAGAMNRSVAGHEGRPVRMGIEPDVPSFLAFALPSPLDQSNPRIRYEGSNSAVFELPSGERNRLSEPEPAFELLDVTVPEQVQQGSTLSVSLTVRNVSETDGRFLAALYWPSKLIADDDESVIVERGLRAGEEATIERSIDTRYTVTESQSVTLSIDGHVRTSQDVAVSVDSST